MTPTTPRRRSTDRQPSRETYLQERVIRLDEELNLVRAENARLRRELAIAKTQGAWGSFEPTAPAGLVV